MVGLDVGTMNLVSALEMDGKVVFKKMRNMYLKSPKSYFGSFDLSKISYVEMDDDIYIVGEDAYNFANVFMKPVNRPMRNGVISPDDIDAGDVLAAMFSKLLENAPSNKCVFSCPDNPKDNDYDIIYHRELIKRILSSLGFEPYPLNEALALVYSNCANTDFSGIGISFGAGMTNVALAYKSIPVVTFSVARGGDWIDKNAATSVGAVPTHITLIKESRFSLVNPFASAMNRRDRKVCEAISFYYREFISYVVDLIISELSKVTSVIDSIPIVIGGGTSMVDGFIDAFKSIFEVKSGNLLFTISDIIHAKNPLMDVAEGCLVKARTLQ